MERKRKEIKKKKIGEKIPAPLKKKKSALISFCQAR
jgi:hypothetical protein